MFCGTACCVFEKNAKYPKFHDSTNFKAVFWRFYGQNAYFISVVLHLLVINKRPFYLKNEANLCFLGKIGESIYFDIFVVSGRFLIKVKILGPTISRMSRWSWGSMLLTPMRSPIFKWIISPRDPMTIDPITIPGRPTHPSLSPAISGRWVWRSCATKIGFSQLHIRSRVKKGPTQPFSHRIWVGSPYNPRDLCAAKDKDVKILLDFKMHPPTHPSLSQLLGNIFGNHRHEHTQTASQSPWNLVFVLIHMTQ